jgi:hypothetical protein
MKLFIFAIFFVIIAMVQGQSPPGMIEISRQNQKNSNLSLPNRTLPFASSQGNLQELHSSFLL